ncbi:Bro-N domain-containing protein [Candidatus Poribacteria bacterium]|nr:Bro-N domain-containing protein [Candidatus Poribacteria bacterium]
MKKKDITKIAVFSGKRIRRQLVNNEWWLSVVDVCGVLTDSVDAGAYWRKLKERLKEEGSEVVTFCHGLKLEAPDGKLRETDCANTEGILRIIQSVPSPKAEPFKRWLAKVGKERLDEIENPELGMQRTKALYEKKGYSKEWIDKRLRGIAVRQKLTDEWDSRGVETDLEYSILTNEIMQGAFEMQVDDYIM